MRIYPTGISKIYLAGSGEYSNKIKSRKETTMIVPEIYDTYKHEIGDIGIIEGITFGSAYGFEKEVLLFDIRNSNKEWVKSYISGDFKVI